MLTLASTNRFVADPLPPGPLFPDVERVTVAELGVPLPLNAHTAVALAVNDPAELLLIWNEHVAVFPLLVRVGEPQVLFRIGVALPTMLGVSDVNDAVVPAGEPVLVTVNV